MSILLALAFVLQAAAGPSDANRNVAPPRQIFRPFCLFANGDATLDLDSLSADSANELLSKHADAHGWRWSITGPQFVERDRAVACPDSLLDHLELPRELHEESGAFFLYRRVAQVLHRNGRSQAAIDLLLRAREQEKRLETGEVWDAHRLHKSSLSEFAALIAADCNRWEEALALSEGWTVDSGCSLGAMAEESGITSFRARCLIGSGRYKDAQQMVKTLSHSWSTVPEWLLLLLECQLSWKPTESIDAALTEILADAPSGSKDCRERAKDLWLLSQAARDVQLQRLEDLAAYFPELAFPLLLSLDSADLSRQMRALEVVDGHLSGPSAALLLIETGFPEVGSALERAISEVSQDSVLSSLDYKHKEWSVAHRRWLLLTGSGG